MEDDDTRRVKPSVAGSLAKNPHITQNAFGRGFERYRLLTEVDFRVARDLTRDSAGYVIISTRCFEKIVSLPLHNAWFWALAACVAAALLEGIMSGTGIKARFAELRLPNSAPGLWAWSVIGGAYYVLFFFLLRSLLARPPIPFWTSVILTLTAMLLIANASWNWIFFRKKDLWLSFVFFVPYLLLSLTLGVVLHRIRSPLAGWYALYPAYLVFATWWGYRVWRLNNSSSQNSDLE